MPRTVLSCAIALFAGTLLSLAEEGVKITQAEDHVRVEINGELFTQYWYQGKQHPALLVRAGVTNSIPTKHVYFYPITGPGGVHMTRSWPMVNNVPGEAKDHEHHRGLWFSHGKVNGFDFWAENAKAGKIVHDQFQEVKSGKDEGVIKSTCKWVAPDGKVVCTDERVFRVYNRPANERLFDYEITIKAPENREVLLGDTKEGSMSIRVNEQMRVSREKNLPATGHIVLSTGIRDDAPLEKAGTTKTWGKRSEWCDYWGTVDGKKVGVAIFNHPGNPVHPTPWHVRDYGLFAANPFGIHDFEKKEPGAGNITIPAGKSVTFKYRFYVHEGDEKQGKVDERFKEYAATAK